MKTYKIKSDEHLFNKWMGEVSKTSNRIDFFILQNDCELTSEQLNEWYKKITEQIKESQKDFAKTIKNLTDLRDLTVEYIKDGGNPFD
jgi:NACalpha-BTF3-like transcription factor